MNRARTPRGEETRDRIRAAALALFQEKGFEASTMREVASLADVATGAAYYYFPSKEALVLEFYTRVQDELETTLPAALEGRRDLGERLKAVLELKFSLIRPYRRVLGALVRAGLDPENPVSPFSTDTAPLRGRHLAIFERALEGSEVKIPPDLARHLPRLLWLYDMGLVLFWLFDRSEGQARTDRLIARSLETIVTAIHLARFRVTALLRKAVVRLLADIEESPHDPHLAGAFAQRS
ncbi:MAG TPA: TetR family transcriptional regulator [Thermoanaerobaculia bacterium]|nr:TetR family transcriptional regulator [Thermoanaerobaculia bacterium]